MNRAANIPSVSYQTIHDGQTAEIGDAFHPSINGTDSFSEEVASAQSQLDALRQRQEAIEHRKDELERLHKKQSFFTAERECILADLSHSLEIIDRDTADAEQLITQYSQARQRFLQSLELISNLRDHEWERNQLNQELDKAGETLSQIRQDYVQDTTELALLTKGFRGIRATSLKSGEKSQLQKSGHTFLYWLRSGFAFSLPIITFALALLALIAFN